VFEYYKHAAHLGKAKAQYNFWGIMYYNGQGVEKVMAKAREWLTKVEQSSAKLAKQYTCR
jgi:TPR repeat protein